MNNSPEIGRTSFLHRRTLKNYSKQPFTLCFCTRKLNSTELSRALSTKYPRSSISIQLGGSPYPDVKARQIADRLQEGYRMPRPKHVDDTLWVNPFHQLSNALNCRKRTFPFDLCTCHRSNLYLSCWHIYSPWQETGTKCRQDNNFDLANLKKKSLWTPLYLNYTPSLSLVIET